MLIYKYCQNDMNGDVVDNDELSLLIMFYFFLMTFFLLEGRTNELGTYQNGTNILEQCIKYILLCYGLNVAYVH